MRALIFIITFLGSVFLMVAGELTSPPGVESHPNLDLEFALVPHKLVVLSANEFEKVVLAAERSNDVTAAVDLADYYCYAIYNVDKHIKYLEIAAKHGHVVSQYNLGFTYYYVPRVKNLTKAKYWLEIAAQSGSEPAKRVLGELKRELANYSSLSGLGFSFLTIALVSIVLGIAISKIAKRKPERDNVA